MCATYGKDYEITHMCRNGDIKTDSFKDSKKEEGKKEDDNNSIKEEKEVKKSLRAVKEVEQLVRDARHKDHSFNVQGKKFIV